MSTAQDLCAQPFGPGNVNCGGCTMGIAMKLALEELGPDTILSIPACCAAVSVGSFPNSAVHIPLLLHAFETTGASISGIQAALEVRGEKGINGKGINVVGWAGDGGTFDIGIQALSGAAERNEDVMYVCYDNEAYMNTGVQRSGATPVGAWTTTTPMGKPSEHPKKDMMGIIAAHKIPYAATASIAFHEDFKIKFRRAAETKGFRFLLIQSPCPTGWRSDAKDGVLLARLGVESGIFPLMEIEGGKSWTLNYEPTFEGLDEYFDLQRRFGTLTAEQRAAAKVHIEEDWAELRMRANRK